MGKKLIHTNPYLRVPEERNKALWVGAYTSSRIEGVRKKDLEEVKRKLYEEARH